MVLAPLPAGQRSEPVVRGQVRGRGRAAPEGGDRGPGPQAVRGAAAAGHGGRGTGRRGDAGLVGHGRRPAAGGDRLSRTKQYNHILITERSKGGRGTTDTRS